MSHPITLAETSTLMRRATQVAVIVSVALVVAKALAWWLTDSVAVLSTMIDSLMDVMLSIMSYFTVRLALKPSDHNHTHGHGKVEPLMTLVQTAIIIMSALVIIVQAIERFNTPQLLIQNEAIGIATIVISMLATFVLLRFQKHVIDKTKSLTVAVDSLHYQTDFWINAGVLVSLALSWYSGAPFIDPLFAIGIALIISYKSLTLSKDAVHMLMDHELTEKDRQLIIALASQQPEVRSVSDLKTRTSGPDVFIQMNLLMDRTLSLAEADRIVHEAEAQIKKYFANAIITIHPEPYSIHTIAGVKNGHSA